jgi:hypothetical protein
LSNNAEFDAEFSFAGGSDPFSNAPRDGTGPQSTAFGGHTGPSVKPSKSKPNLVVRAWRAVTGFVGGIGKAVFSKEFWVEFIATALRDALAALGYSIGMRMIKKATATGDLIFKDKQGHVATPENVSSASPTKNWQSGNRRGEYGFSDDFMASPIGNQAFRQSPFRN